MPTALQPVRMLVVGNTSDPFAEILRVRGYDAIAVFGAKEALALAEISAPQAVISEVSMCATGDGVRLAIRLSERFPSCKVIMYAANMKKASRCLRGHQQFPLLKRPTRAEDTLTFVVAVDAIVLSPF